MPDAIQTLISDVEASKVSSNPQPIVAPVDDFVAAMNEIETAIGGGIVPSTIVLTDNHILVGNASNVGSDVPMSGDATIVASGALTLVPSGVTAGTYGDGTHYPVITVDAKGRITTASQDALPAGVTGANPTATAGPAAHNGVASTFMRSDASPAIQLATSGQAGLVQGDGSTVSIAAGVISATAANAAGTQAGVVTIDNVSIHINGSGKLKTGIRHPGFAAGRYYTGYGFSQAGTFSSFSANVLRGVPFYAPFPVTFTRVAIDCNTASGNLEFGIYNTANGVPSSLLYDLGSHPMTVTHIEITGLTIALDAGTYCLCVAQDSAAQFPTGNIVTGNCETLGSTDTGSGSAASGWSGAWTFSGGALPGTFPSPAFLDNATVPSIFLRL